MSRIVLYDQPDRAGNHWIGAPLWVPLCEAMITNRRCQWSLYDPLAPRGNQYQS